MPESQLRALSGWIATAVDLDSLIPDLLPSTKLDARGGPKVVAGWNLQLLLTLIGRWAGSFADLPLLELTEAY
jgi:hypothetical protein